METYFTRIPVNLSAKIDNLLLSQPKIQLTGEPDSISIVKTK
jgi:hypothetical protein